MSHAEGDTALACQLPAETGVPPSWWSCPELAREAVEHGIATFLSASTVHRWLARDAIKPWQHRSWLSHPAPEPTTGHPTSLRPLDRSTASDIWRNRHADDRRLRSVVDRAKVA
ncbi:hypothetical protein ACFC0R_33070 [Streptomyces sp. NPDC056086]|uniref:hypothetical protein n=1 Tax=Streptomyces sp. NPDC056086 TaxID=3345709 RepID=UPI0035D94EFD